MLNHKMSKRLSECISKNEEGLFVFDYVKFAENSTSAMNLQHYKNDVENFLNTRIDLMCCPGCGKIDSELNLLYCIVHDEDKCLKYHLINYVWRNIGILGRNFPSFHIKKIQQLYKDGMDWCYRRESRQYSYILSSYQHSLIKDWDINMFVNNNECSYEFKMAVMTIIKSLVT